MIHGPSAGPAMVLNILMRWPALIVALPVGGAGTVLYGYFAFPEAPPPRAEAAQQPTAFKALLTQEAPLGQNTMTVTRPGKVRK